MKINKLIIPFLSLAALLTSCIQEEIGGFYAEVKAEPSYVSLPGDGGSKEIVVTTADSWNISGIPDWLDVEPKSGDAAPNGVKVTLSALKTYESHTAEISINVGKVSQIVTVSQTLGNDIKVTTVKEFVESGVDGRTYVLQGIVSNITNTLYGNFYLNDGTSETDAYIYGMLDASGASKNFLSLGIEEGDEIKLSGPRTTYGTTIEIVDASLIEIVKKALLTAEKSSFTVTCEAGTFSFPVAVKGDDLTASDPSGDWLKFKGIEGSGEETKVIVEYDENTGEKSREASFVLKTVKKADKDDKDAKDIVSELTIKVMQMPAFPKAKKVADVDFAGKEFVNLEGQVAALTKEGFVLYDGSTNAVNKIYVTYEGFKYEDYAIGAKVQVVGNAENSYALNSIAADYLKVLEEEGKYEDPKAVEITKANANGILTQSPATCGFYKVSGYVSSSKNVIISGAAEYVSAVSVINDLDLKAYAGKYVTVYGYHTNSNTKDGDTKIQLVLTEVEELEESPKFFELPTAEEELDWNETSVKFEVLTNEKWTAIVSSAVEDVLISKKAGEGTAEIEVRFPGKNNTYDDQVVVVTVTCGQEEKEFTVTRSGKDLEFELEKVEYTSQEAKIVVKIKASKYWKVSVDNSAAKLDKTEGMGEDAVILTIPENKTGSDVVYTLTLTEDRVSGEAQTATLQITHLAIAGIQTEGEGTEESPYTPADADKLVKANFHDANAEIYISGIISEIEKVDTGYGNANFYISADGTKDNQFYIYRSMYLENAKFEDPDQIRVGDKVLIIGKLGAFKDVPQIMQGGHIVSIDRAEVKFDVTPKSYSFEKEAGEFAVELLCKFNGFDVNPSADWITVKGISAGENAMYTVSLAYEANEGGARSATVDFVANGETMSVAVEQAGAIVAKTAAEINAAEDGPAIYRLTGYLSSIAKAEYGNIYIKDYTGEVYVYGSYGPEKEGFSTLGINAGDIVTVEGPKTSYKENPQMKDVTITSHIPVTDVTVADFLTKEVEGENPSYFRLTGTVKNIVMDKNDPTTPNVYGNFDIEDETGTVYVYGLLQGWGGPSKKFNEMDVKDGDKITIVGVRADYKGTAQVGSAFYVSHVE